MITLSPSQTAKTFTDVYIDQSLRNLLQIIKKKYGYENPNHIVDKGNAYPHLVVVTICNAANSRGGGTEVSNSNDEAEFGDKEDEPRMNNLKRNNFINI